MREKTLGAGNGGGGGVGGLECMAVIRMKIKQLVFLDRLSYRRN